MRQRLFPTIAFLICLTTILTRRFWQPSLQSEMTLYLIDVLAFGGMIYTGWLTFRKRDLSFKKETFNQFVYDLLIPIHRLSILLTPRNPYKQLSLGRSYEQIGRTEAALSAYERSIELAPENVLFHDNLGWTYYRLGRMDDALAAYQRALQVDPDYATTLNNLGVLYDGIGQTEDAIAVYQRASLRSPNFVFPHYNLGRTYRQLGRFDDAIAAYQAALKIDTRYAPAVSGLADVYRKIGRKEDAIAAYKRAIKLSPAYKIVHISLAGIYKELGDLKKFNYHVVIARQFITQEGDYNRACLEAVVGNVELACALLKKAIDESARAVDHAKSDADFDFIRDAPCFQALVAN